MVGWLAGLLGRSSKLDWRCRGLTNCGLLCGSIAVLITVLVRPPCLRLCTTPTSFVSSVWPLGQLIAGTFRVGSAAHIHTRHECRPSPSSFAWCFWMLLACKCLRGRGTVRFSHIHIRMPTSQPTNQSIREPSKQASNQPTNQPTCSCFCPAFLGLRTTSLPS